MRRNAAATAAERAWSVRVASLAGGREWSLVMCMSLSLYARSGGPVRLRDTLHICSPCIAVRPSVALWPALDADRQRVRTSVSDCLQHSGCTAGYQSASSAVNSVVVFSSRVV